MGPLKIEDIFFSNVCSAIRRKILLKNPSDEQLIMSEDQQWAKDMLIAGYSIAYQPKAIVKHSHNYNLLTVFRRFFDSGVSFRQMKEKGDFTPGLTKEGLYHIKLEIKYLIEKGYTLKIPYAFVYNAMKYLGVRIGMENKKLPTWLNKKMSHHKYFWETKSDQPK